MPRLAREKSDSATYHIMLRGINRQQIFEETEDCEKFIEILQHYQAVSEYKVYAYCLMGNHVHLLMEFGKEDIAQAMKRISTKYVYWYNTKYERNGHLFQDRFKSEPVDDDAYFLTVLRYIHQNPIKAGLCKRVDEYRFSSFGEYKNGARLVNVEYVYNYIPQADFEKFNNETESTVCLDVEDRPTMRVTDEEAKRIMLKCAYCSNASEFQALPIEKRNKYLIKLKENGLSIRQISRLTGISYYIIQKV